VPYQRPMLQGSGRRLDGLRGEKVGSLAPRCVLCGSHY
jgi:hypothetical protein